MQMRRMLWGAVCSLAAAGIATAQMPVAVGVTLGAGGTFRGYLPNSSATYYNGLGYNLVGGITLIAPVLPVSIRFEAQYNQFSAPLGLYPDRIYSASVNPIYTFPIPIVHPYLIGGFGYYHMTASAFNPTSVPGNPSDINETLNGFGLNGGAGLRTGFSGFGLFAEWRYHYVFDGGAQTPGGHASFAPFTFGMTL
jgi:hypothetical protein